jgi:outer membrane protein OmpA-like peptidoglycan-associated protein
VLSGALFDLDKATLHEEAEVLLRKLAQQLTTEFPDTHIQIVGYTDDTGPAEYNNRLGLRRAESVRAFLASSGVPESSMTAQSGGENNPVATNATPEGRQLNRRVVIQKQ